MKRTPSAPSPTLKGHNTTVPATRFGPAAPSPPVQTKAGPQRPPPPVWPGQPLAPHSTQVAQLAKYIPPHLREGGDKKEPEQKEKPVPKYIPPRERKKRAFIEWLSKLDKFQILELARNKRGDAVVELSQKINMDGQDRSVRMNIHLEKGPTAGSIWMEGVVGVSLNGEENPKARTILYMWLDK